MSLALTARGREARRRSGVVLRRITESVAGGANRLRGKAGILTGALVGAMLTAALIAIFYPAWRLAGLPFVAFDVFDWMARILPGSVITYGIDTLVRVIRALDLGATAEAAKTAEKAMAIAGMFITGVITGAVPIKNPIALSIFTLNFWNSILNNRKLTQYERTPR
jgi:hypothetical protein